MKKTTYDKQAEALYIDLKKGESFRTEEINDGVLIDYDKNEDVLGIEVYEINSQNMELAASLLATLTYSHNIIGISNSVSSETIEEIKDVIPEKEQNAT